MGDITYIETQEGWLYLAGILDLYSRKLVGWAMSEHIATKLVLKALAMACLHRQPPANLLFHSDRGVQYASGDYRQALRAAGLAAIFHPSCEIYFPAVNDVFSSIFPRHRAAQTDFSDFSTHAPLPPFFIRAGDSTFGVYPVLKALASCAKMF